MQDSEKDELIRQTRKGLNEDSPIREDWAVLSYSLD